MTSHGRLLPGPRSQWTLPPAPVLRDQTIDLDPSAAASNAAARLALEDPDFYRWGYIDAQRPVEWNESWLRQRALREQLGAACHFAVGLGARETTAGLIELWVVDAFKYWGEIGYWIHPSHRGQGLASRALRLLSEWALDRAGARQLDLPIHPENAPSQAVARNAGYRLRGSCRHTQPVGGSWMVDLYTRNSVT